MWQQAQQRGSQTLISTLESGHFWPGSQFSVEDVEPLKATNLSGAPQGTMLASFRLVLPTFLDACHML